MAYGDFQTFLPSESLYKEPGMALVAAKAEGAKRASYLSSMDQFYAELEEKTRQFDRVMDWKNGGWILEKIILGSNKINLLGKKRDSVERKT